MFCCTSSHTFIPSGGSAESCLNCLRRSTVANLLDAHATFLALFVAVLAFDFLLRVSSALSASLVEACIGTAVCRSFRIFFRGAMFHKKHSIKAHHDEDTKSYLLSSKYMPIYLNNYKSQRRTFGHTRVAPQLVRSNCVRSSCASVSHLTNQRSKHNQNAGKNNTINFPYIFPQQVGVITPYKSGGVDPV